MNMQMPLKPLERIYLSYKKTVEQIIYLLKKTNKSRLIYVGAGTSGRIGVQDGVELYPTFGWPSARVEFIIPGGNEA